MAGKKEFRDNDGILLKHCDVIVDMMSGDALALDLQSSKAPITLNLYDLSRKSFTEEFAKQCKHECKIHELQEPGTSLYAIMKKYGKEENVTMVRDYFNVLAIEKAQKKVKLGKVKENENVVER